MRTNVRCGLGAAGAALLFLTTACGGGGGGDRPSTSEISKALRSGEGGSILGDAGSKLDKDAADCLGKVLHDSKLSDGALRAIVKNDKDYKASKADEKAAQATTGELGKCVTPSTK